MGIIHSIPNRSLTIFSLDYSLVPEARYPTQLQQVVTAYKYLLTVASSDKIIVAGDSAGASILISFLLHIVRPNPALGAPSHPLSTPAGVILISPWCRLDSYHESRSHPANTVDEDYLDPAILDEYARLYTGATIPQSPLPILFPLSFWLSALKGLINALFDPPYTSKWLTLARIAALESHQDPRDAPIHSYLCKSPYRNPFAALDYPDWLADALPQNTLVIYGGKEAMASDILEFTDGLKRLSKGSVRVETRWKLGVHSWPVMDMYLGLNTDETQCGVLLIAEYVTKVMRIGE